MATIDKIEQELTKAEVEYGKADKKLNDWEEGENGGKWLEELRGKVRSGELSEREEGQLVRLEEKEKSLEAEKKRWGDQVEEWGKALRGFGGGEGNEQIALKKNYFSFIPFRLFICLFE